MSNEEELKALAELKKELEERLAKLEKEMEHVKLLLKLTDAALAARSFKPASKLVEAAEGEAEAAPSAVEAAPSSLPTPTPPVSEALQEIPLRSSQTGELLARMFVGRDFVRIVPADDKSFSIKVPPFNTFFVERILAEMRRKDEEQMLAGLKDEDEVLYFEVRTDGDIIKEIFIGNIKDRNRVREIRSALRWTLERMLEKTR
ncbi:MAG TPA: hypothetical protein ENF82_03980 [Candidatus Methanomethylia archaeon]|nr:hypothetical protein [Candidatus Methanomethylicia archaeon]